MVNTRHSPQITTFQNLVAGTPPPVTVTEFNNWCFFLGVPFFLLFICIGAIGSGAVIPLNDPHPAQGSK